MRDSLPFYFIAVLVGAAIGITLSYSLVGDCIASETITAYTPKDIIYLKGNQVYSESGEVDIRLASRKEAIRLFENLTVDRTGLLTADYIVPILNTSGEDLDTYQAKPYTDSREYQFDIDQEGYTIYAGERYIGFLPHGENPTLDLLISRDNE